jgi:hypothetical protein
MTLVSISANNAGLEGLAVVFPRLTVDSRRRIPLDRKCTSFDFRMRPRVLSSAGRRGISRFPSKVLAYMHGVSDRAAASGRERPGIQSNNNHVA